jgi:hypothetical protein
MCVSQIPKLAGPEAVILSRAGKELYDLFCSYGLFRQFRSRYREDYFKVNFDHIYSKLCFLEAAAGH